jgi:hypothetical protein
MAKRYLKDNKGTEVIQEHPRATSTPPPSAQLDLIRPIDHLTSTTTRTQRDHGTSSRTRAATDPSVLPHDYDMLHFFLCSSQLDDPFDCACTWLSEAVPSTGRIAAEPRAHPCLRVLCMTASRACRDGPQNLILFSRRRAEAVLCSQDSLVRVLI